ncbi:MAG: phage/plasmid primase, P4 family [Bacteroidota bacterium]
MEILEIKTVEYKGNDIFDGFFIELEQNNMEMPESDFVKYFLLWFKNAMFYNVDSRDYHIFNNKYYKIDKEVLEIHRKITEFIEELQKYIISKGMKDTTMVRLLKFKTQNKIESFTKALKVASRIERHQINQHENLFNVQNGIINLDNFELISHSNEYRITQIADVIYNPSLGEVSGEAKQILLSFFLGDEDILNFMFEYLGASLSGYAGIRKFVYAFGNGKNGKSTFFGFFVNSFFGDYATTTNFQAFVGTRDNTRASSDLVPLFEKRLVVTNEAQTDHKLNTNLIKSITGGDNINARLNYANDETFKPHCKLVMFGNNQLEIDDSSEGMRDRYVQVPFMAKFTKFNQISQNEIWDILSNNKSEILNSLIAGYKRIIKNGFSGVQTIERASLDGFASANSFVRFINDCLVQEIGSIAKTKDIYTKYKEFAKAEDLTRSEIMKKSSMINSLKSSGIKITYDPSKRIEYADNYRLDNDEII